jgi:uncharacterized protein YbjQ (UPF0145 family)
MVPSQHIGQGKIDQLTDILINAENHSYNRMQHKATQFTDHASPPLQ